MTEPKRFKRGKHTYTRWGHNFKEVRVQGKAKPKEPAPPVSSTLSVDLDAQTAQGVYSNLTMVHHSSSEVVVDFVFVPPGQKRGRTRSRVILPFQEVRRLHKIFTKAIEEVDRQDD